MSLDNFQLNGFLIRELYKDSLVVMEDHENDGPVQNQLAIKSLGNNYRHVLLLVNNPAQPFLDDADLDFTGKWLGAIGHSLADVAIVNLANVNQSFQEWCPGFSPKTVLVFGSGSEVLGLPLQFPPYQVQHFNGVNYLVSDPLDKIASDASLKKQFWACLKTAFSL